MGCSNNSVDSKTKIKSNYEQEQENKKNLNKNQKTNYISTENDLQQNKNDFEINKNNIQENKIDSNPKDKNLQEKQLENKGNIYNYNYCYTEEEILEINQMKSTLNNNIVFYKCMCEVNQDYTYHKEYITIKTEKKIGEKYSSTYQFESSSVSDKPENYSIKVNNREINTYRPTFFFQNFSASIDYELQPEEDSVVTFEINSKIKTGIYHSFARVYCKNINSPFSFRVKCSDYFIFNSPSDYNFTNVFKVISAREILLKGNKHQNYLNFSFKSKNDIILPKNDKAFYYCNEKELKELEFVINSTG